MVESIRGWGVGFRAVQAWALRRRTVQAVLLYADHRGPVLASAITYQAMFSLAASLLLCFSAASAWLSSDGALRSAVVSAINGVIPGLVGEDGVFPVDVLMRPVGAGFAGVIGVAGLVWSALGVVGSLRAAILELSDRTQDRMGPVRALLGNASVALVAGVGVLVAGVASLGGRLAVRAVADALGVSDSASSLLGWIVPVAITLLLDVGVLAFLFAVLAPSRPAARILWPGALLGGLGLIILQNLSSVFVGSAGSNPLLVSFGSLIALLLWINLSSQVILIAAAYVQVTAEEESRRRAGSPPETLAERRVERSRHRLDVARRELAAALQDLPAERTGEEGPSSEVKSRL